VEHTYWVYILASGFRGTLYVGITNSLERRIAEHKAKEIRGFTEKHGVDRLVYFRGFGEVTEAIHFEKQLKRWRRDWKIRLIEEANHRWADLYLDMMALPPLHPDIAAALEANTNPNNKACHPGFAAGEDRDP
jgi:putative endonuclease